MESTVPIKRWLNWIYEHRDKLNIKDFKEEELACVSFKDGYRQAVIDAGVWWYEYLSKSEFCEMEGYGSADDAVVNFLKDMEE